MFYFDIAETIDGWYRSKALSTEGIHFYAEEKREERCGETNVNWTTIRRKATFLKTRGH